MSTMLRRFSLLGVLGLAGAVGILAGCKSMGPGANVYQVNLSVSNEVPPVNSTAIGDGSVTINTDHTVIAKITVSGMTATAAHIHEGAAGTNGPVIVPFTKTADNVFEAPAGAKLTGRPVRFLHEGQSLHQCAQRQVSRRRGSRAAQAEVIPSYDSGQVPAAPAIGRPEPDVDVLLASRALRRLDEEVRPRINAGPLG